MKMIITSECEECEFGSIDDANKSRIKVKCLKKGKEYIYGQCIPCEEKRKVRKEEENEEDGAVL